MNWTYAKLWHEARMVISIWLWAIAWRSFPQPERGRLSNTLQTVSKILKQADDK